MDEDVSSGPDVRLREVAAADLAVFYEHQRDPEATAMAAFPARDWDAFAAHWDKILADDTVLARTVLADRQVVGNIVSFVQAGERDVGYWLGHDAWGQGVGTKALAAFLRVETRRPLMAHVAKRNLASRRVLEKCGFAVCGEVLVGVEPEEGDSGTPAAGTAPVEELILRLE